MEILLQAVLLLVLLAVCATLWQVRQAATRLTEALDRDEPQPRVIRVPADVPDLSGVDFDAPQPLGSGQHDHVWGPQPFEQDAWSRSFRCQVPRCARVHTQMVR